MSYFKSIKLENLVDTSNSTSTPLGIDESFVGEWIDSSLYGTSIVSVKADEDSAVNGLIIEYSSDGSTIVQNDFFSIKADSGKIFSFGMANQYMRVSYVNGSTAQTSFNLQTILKNSPIKNSSHRVDDSIVGDDDAELVKAIITGRRDDGIFDNARLDDSNNVMVNSIPHTYSIARGFVTDHTSLLKFGTRTSIIADTPSVVWEGNTALYSYMSSSQQLKVSSSSSEDGVAGTGALSITLYGLDSSFNEIEEIVTMNGVTVVTTTLSFLRIYRASVLTSGTAHTNVGKIIIKNNAQTSEQAVIVAGDASTLMSIWTVPSGKQAYLINGGLSTDSNKGLRVSFYTRVNDGILYPWKLQYRAFLFGGHNQFPFAIPFRIDEKTDIEIRVLTPGAAGVTSAGATFELWYESNT